MVCIYPVYNYDKSTRINWSAFEKYSDFWSDIGECGNWFVGLCLYEEQGQEVPCIFCTKNHDK